VILNGEVHEVFPLRTEEEAAVVCDTVTCESCVEPPRQALRAGSSESTTAPLAACCSVLGAGCRAACSGSRSPLPGRYA
jgi:hypothetical protein